MLRRVLNMECLRPVPVGVVAEIQGAVLHRTAAYLVCGLVGTPLDGQRAVGGGAARVRPGDRDGKLAHFPAELPEVERPDGEDWERLADRMKKLLRCGELR